MNFANVFVKNWFIYTKFFVFDLTTEASLLSLHPPNIEDNTLEFLVPFRSTNKEAVVQPSIATVCWSLELWCCLEIERRITILVLSAIDNTPVTDMDIDTIVRLDAIDGFQFCTAAISISQLIVRSTIQYRTS